MNAKRGQLWRWDGEEYRVLRSGHGWADVQRVSTPAWRKRFRKFPEGAELIGEQCVEAFGEIAVQPFLFTSEEALAWQ